MATKTLQKKVAPKKIVVVAKKTSNKTVIKKNPLWTYKATYDGIEFYHNGKVAGEACFSEGRQLNCSCGTCEFEGVSEFADVMEDNRIPVGVMKDALIEYIHAMKIDNNCAHIIVSNNSFTSNINRILDRVCQCKSDWIQNPNSKNDIRVWVL